eukprot:scaffold6475_cov108-Isochrysis_galbana.AAC.1
MGGGAGGRHWDMVRVATDSNRRGARGQRAASRTVKRRAGGRWGCCAEWARAMQPFYPDN